ncbi:hypothetical protein [Tropicibacter naphthalenivorans]|uniref:hypothetical protein n=1 Tax=Tropicibacter naphthalenivorans TaxID=441103 RepID=UPI00278BECE8|nr:hypothetical protein [Tropicibacter naphthalenivorans]
MEDGYDRRSDCLLPHDHDRRRGELYLHGHGGGQNATYEKGRGSTGAEGPLVAAFDGSHGWFFRNRDKTDVTAARIVAEVDAIIRGRDEPVNGGDRFHPRGG